MGKDKVKVAVVGCGPMAKNMHLPSLARFDDVEIAALCDVNAERLAEVGEAYGVEKRYANYRQMVEETAPDAVFAIGMPHMMYDVWVWLLQQGCNLYIEKPMGLTLHHAQILNYLAQENGCVTQVSFQRRACPLLVGLRDECLKRGAINHAICRFYKCEVEKPLLLGFDHMMCDGVHSIDTLRWLCGGEVVDIDCVTRRIGVPDVNFLIANLHFDNGAIGQMVSSWASGRRLFAVEMHAPGVMAEGDPQGEGVFFADNDKKGVRTTTQEAAGSDDGLVFQGFEAKKRDFIDALKEGRRPESDFADAVKTMEVAERILAYGKIRGE